MIKKYIVIGNWIRSRSDYDLHYITANRLCILYHINPEECYLLEGKDRFFHQKYKTLPKLPLLLPRSDGDYQLTNAIIHEENVLGSNQK